VNQPSSPEPIEIRIRPNTRWFHFDWEGLKAYSDLLWILVHRDFTAKYKQTILGPLWFFLNPLIMTFVFVVVFSRVMGASTDGLPDKLFYLCGMLGWTYFSAVLGSTSNSLGGNAHLFSKVYFPRLIPPIAVTISCLLALAIQLVTFGAFYLHHHLTVEPAQVATPSWLWLAYPAIVLHMAFFGLGVGLVLSALTAKYRDVQHVQPVLINLWMYASPVIYPLSKIPEQFRWIVELNPLTAIVEATRLIFLGTGTVSTSSYLVSLGISALVFFIGLFAYQRAARTFVDTV
jgi:lipopolysaccharide transport system permease protein